jgi:hypothetical protein
MIDPDVLIEDPEVMLGYMRAKHKGVFHNSNIFIRDLQYSVRDYFEDMEGKTITIPQAEQIAKDIARNYEQLGVFKRVNPQGYVLNYPELLTPESGTIGVLSSDAPLPPMRGTPAAALNAAEAAMNAAPVKAAPAKPAAPPKAAAAPGAPTPPVAPAASGSAQGGLPAGAMTTPPWLKK